MSPEIALAHDWFANRGGAERVALSLAQMFPGAPMYTAIAFPEASFPEVNSLDLRTTSLQRRIKDPSKFRSALPKYPAAWRELDATGYEAVVASTSAFAHHLKTDGCLIAYCYQPPRFLYDKEIATGLAPIWARAGLPLLLNKLRRLDLRAASLVHRYLAVSKGAAKRIESVYGVKATPVYPPVDVARFQMAPRTSDHWILVSRLVPHRDVELAIRAFNQLRIPLVVVGEGPDRPRLESIAKDHVRFAGRLEDDELLRLYGEARGAIVPGVEDLGLVALEANASGRPVVARAKGGSLETVIDGHTGSLFLEPDVTSVVRAVKRASLMEADPQALRAHAMQFDRPVFEAKMREVVAARTSCIACQRQAR